jgi:CheY-like chemotaxis protein
MDGFELLRSLRQASSTAGDHAHHARLGRGPAPGDTLGANAYLVKSEFEEAALLETVERHLGRLR